MRAFVCFSVSAFAGIVFIHFAVAAFLLLISCLRTAAFKWFGCFGEPLPSKQKHKLQFGMFAMLDFCHFECWDVAVLHFEMLHTVCLQFCTRAQPLLGSRWDN